MKPFTSKEGRLGVRFEGQAEISALAAGLTLIIDQINDPSDAVLGSAAYLRDVAKRTVEVNNRLATDPTVREFFGSGNDTESTVVLDLDRPLHLHLASIGLQAAATHHENPITRGAAEATHDEMVQVLYEQGLIAPPVQQPPQQ